MISIDMYQERGYTKINRGNENRREILPKLQFWKFCAN